MGLGLPGQQIAKTHLWDSDFFTDFVFIVMTEDSNDRWIRRFIENHQDVTNKDARESYELAGVLGIACNLLFAVRSPWGWSPTA